MEQARQLLADLEDGKQPPPRKNVDGLAELQLARDRFRAAKLLTALPLDEACQPLLDQLLGPAESVDEVLKRLDQQYREAGRPAVWFLPLDEPIAPHLDELLGSPGGDK